MVRGCAASSEWLVTQSKAIVEDLCGAKFCEQGTSIGHAPEESPRALPSSVQGAESIHKFRPYYVHLDYPSQIKGTWNAIAPARMLLVSRGSSPDSKRFDFFEPADIDRAIPRAFDPDEQRLAPSVDLVAEGKALDRKIAALFLEAVEAALATDDKDAERTRPELLERLLPALKTAVFSYPGHSGPAHAAGASAFSAWALRLEVLLVDEDFPSYVDGYWPATALAYDTSLVPLLRDLPPARGQLVDQLAESLDEWARRAVKHPGYHPTEVASYCPSPEELVLSELGFRQRTALRITARGPTTGGKVEVFRFRIRHPLAQDRLPPKAFSGFSIRF